MSNTDTGPRDITADHETIREWVEQRDGTPARMVGETADAQSLYIVQEGEAMEDLEPMSWDDFFETFEDEGLAFVHQDRDVGETDEWLYDLIDREEVAERASLETTDVEQSLLDGEVVRSEITETKVIETTVVATDQIESEVVDSEIVESNLVDRETVSREVIGVSFVDAPDDLRPTLRSAPGEPRAATEDTDHDSMTATEGDVDHDSTTPEDSPVDEPADKTIPDPPVERRSSHREEANRTATSQESIKRDATGQQPGERRGSNRQSTDDLSTDRQTDDDTTDQPLGDDTSDRQPVDEMTAEPATGRQRDMESTVGLAVGNDVALDVHDTVRMTSEVFDRKTVESRVVDQEITEADSVESDAIDIQGIEESILESDLIAGEIMTDELDEPGETDVSTTGLPSGAITSERTEGDTVHSQFVERRLVETESTEHHQLRCDITDHTLADTLDSRSTLIERAIVDREADEEVMLQEPEAGGRTTDEQVTAAEESATPTAGADAELASEPGGDTGEAGATDSPPGMEEITDDEIGKEVVSGDKDVGMVSGVDTDSQTLYVDPEPSLTDRIKATLDWGDTDDDSYPVQADQIESINEEKIRITEV